MGQINCHLLVGRGVPGAISFFYQVQFLYALPQFLAEKTVTFPPPLWKAVGIIMFLWDVHPTYC